MAYFVASFDFLGNDLQKIEVHLFEDELLEFMKKKQNVMCFYMFSGMSTKSKPEKTTPLVFLEGERYNKTLPVVYMNDEKYQEISRQVSGTELTDIIVVRGKYIPVKPTTVIYGVNEIKFLNKTLSSKQTVVFESDDSDDEQEDDSDEKKQKQKERNKKGKNNEEWVCDSLFLFFLFEIFQKSI